MSDHVSAFTVVLDHDLTAEDAVPVIEAIQMIKFVAGVRRADTATHPLIVAGIRRDRAWEEAAYALIRVGPEKMLELVQASEQRRP